MMEDRFLKRLRKKARKGLRGWPIATIAFYGPNLSQATKVTVGIVPSENAEVEELRDWKVDCGVSRPKGFHLRPLSEPDVNLAAHPAPIIHPTTDSPSTNGPMRRADVAPAV